MELRGKHAAAAARDPAQGARKAERAHMALKNAIMLGVHPPGTQFLEQSLAAQLGCSQSTVREALQKLAEDGLVERRGYQGTVVTETTLDEAAEMVRIRLRIERTAARRLAGSGIDTEPLVAITQAMDGARREDDGGRCAELDRCFHAGIVRAAGLGVVAPIVSRCALHIHRFTLRGTDTPRRFFEESGMGEEHRALLSAILAGDADAAEQAAVRHLETVIRRWSPPLLEATGAETFA